MSVKKQRRKPGYLVPLILCLLLTGCGEEEEREEQPVMTETVKETEKPEEKVSDDDTLLTVSFEEERTFKDEGGQEWTCSYRIPQLLSDSADAAEINSELLKIQEEAKEYADAAAAGEVPACGSIDYEAFRNGSLLSLILSRTWNYHSDTDLRAYLYDTETEERVEPEELFARFDTSEEIFYGALASEAADWFDEAADQWVKSGAGEPGRVQELRAAALAYSTLSPEQAVVFADGEGILTAAVKFPSFEEDGVQTVLLKPSEGPEQEPRQEVTCGFVKAVLEDNQAVISFDGSEELSARISDAGLEFNQPYPVEGLYGEYTDMEMAIQGQDFLPYLFLTDTHGRVSFCNVMGCALAGGRFFAVGPIPGLQPIHQVEAEETQDGSLVYGVTENGERILLTEEVIPAEKFCPEPLTMCEWISEDGANHLTVNPDQTFAGPEDITGQLFYAGMNQEGLVFPFSAQSETGEASGGVMILEYQNLLAGPEGEFRLTVNGQNGAVLPGFPEDGSVVFRMNR